MPAKSVSVGRDEVLPAANSSRPSTPSSPPQILTMGVGAACMLDRYQHSASAVFIDSLTESQSGLNGTNSMEMKTKEKRSLLAGAIFYDNSGESSVDKNETAHLSGSTGSQSDSSSMSDYSVGESNLSQDSIRNGSSDAKKRSSGRKDKSKLE
ncbi:hypothetical protein OROHE_015461 [Orobanche hederae]